MLKIAKKIIIIKNGDKYMTECVFFAEIFNHNRLERTLETHRKSAAKPKALSELLYMQEAYMNYLAINLR